MHAKLKRATAAAKLERLIDALAEDLAETTDEEVLQACADLGMDPQMRGSAAFLGLKGPSVSWRDFFDAQELEELKAALVYCGSASAATRSSRTALPGRARTAKAGKDDGSEK
jgi:hypothetical protein